MELSGRTALTTAHPSSGTGCAVVVVAALVIDAQETVEQDHLARRAQADLSIGRADLDGRAR